MGNSATKIMVIRHAEKPPASGAPHGVTIKGDQDPQSLIVQGWQRAGALASFFAPTNDQFQNAGLATPEFLYASAIVKKTSSERPQETITPLSAKISLDLNTNYADKDYAQMVEDAVNQKGIVLICWQHEDIPAIANQILGNDTTVPQKWPSDRFDMVWVFDLDTGTETYSFSQVPQCLLAGDSSTPIS